VRIIKQRVIKLKTVFNCRCFKDPKNFQSLEQFCGMDF